MRTRSGQKLRPVSPGEQKGRAAAAAANLNQIHLIVEPLSENPVPDTAADESRRHFDRQGENQQHSIATHAPERQRQGAPVPVGDAETAGQIAGCPARVLTGRKVIGENPYGDPAGTARERQLNLGRARVERVPSQQGRQGKQAYHGARCRASNAAQPAAIAEAVTRRNETA